MTHNLEIQTKYELLVKQLRATLSPEDQEKYDDDLLLRALLSRNQDMEAAKAVLIKYASSRKDYPVLFATATDPRLEGVFAAGMVFHANFLTPHGHHVFFARALDWDPSRHPLDVLIQSIMIVVELKSMDYSIQERGVVLVIDAKDIGWKYVWAVQPRVMHAFGQVITYYMPIHLKNIIVLNTNWAVDAIWKVIKPLLPSELTSKVVLCGKDQEKAAFFLSRDGVATASYVPTPEMRDAYVRDVLSQDHVVQSLRNRYMS